MSCRTLDNPCLLWARFSPCRISDLAPSPFPAGCSVKADPGRCSVRKKSFCGQMGLGNAMSYSICLEIHNAHKHLRDFLEFSAPRHPCGSLVTFLQCYFPRRPFLITQICDPFSSILYPASFFFTALLIFWHCIIFLFIGLFYVPPSTQDVPSVSAGTWSICLQIIPSMWHIVGAQ